MSDTTTTNQLHPITEINQIELLSALLESTTLEDTKSLTAGTMLRLCHIVDEVCEER